MAKILDKSTIQKVARLLTWESTFKIAAEHLAFNLEELGRIWEDKQENSHDAIVEVLRQFRDEKTKGKQSWEVSDFYFLSIL